MSTLPLPPDRASTSSVLLKSTQILGALSDAGRGLRFKDIQQATGLSNATLHRLLGDLLALRLIHHHEEGSTYAVGARLIGWAHHALHDLPIRQAAGEVMTRLRDQTGETVHLAVLEGTRLLYVDKQESTKSVRMYSSVGRTAPLHCTGVGKAILAFQPPEVVEQVIGTLEFQIFTPTTLPGAEELRRELARIRERGHAYDLGEHEDEIRCVAAPVLNRRGVSVGGLSISAPAFRIGADFEALWPALVTRGAREVAHTLGRLSG